MATSRSVVYIKTGEVQVQPIDFPKLVDASNGRKIEHGVILKIISTNIYHGAVTAGVGTGSTVYVAKAGPVGLACAGRGRRHRR